MTFKTKRRLYRFFYYFQRSSIAFLLGSMLMAVLCTYVIKDMFDTTFFKMINGQCVIQQQGQKK